MQQTVKDGVLPEKEYKIISFGEGFSLFAFISQEMMIYDLTS